MSEQPTSKAPAATAATAPVQAPLIEVENLTKYFPIKKGIFSRHVADVKAVDGVSFSIAPGETLGLVGESGCGKTTVGRTILRLIPATAGSVPGRLFEPAGPAVADGFVRTVDRVLQRFERGAHPVTQLLEPGAGDVLLLLQCLLGHLPSAFLIVRIHPFGASLRRSPLPPRSRH